MTKDTDAQGEGLSEDAIFALLTQKYVQRADDRQKSMGLQYTTAETHDLARTIASYIRAALARAESRL